MGMNKAQLSERYHDLLGKYPPEGMTNARIAEKIREAEGGKQGKQSAARSRKRAPAAQAPAGHNPTPRSAPLVKAAPTTQLRADDPQMQVYLRGSGQTPNGTANILAVAVLLFLAFIFGGADLLGLLPR